VRVHNSRMIVPEVPYGSMTHHDPWTTRTMQGVAGNYPEIFGAVERNREAA